MRKDETHLIGYASNETIPVIQEISYAAVFRSERIPTLKKWSVYATTLRNISYLSLHCKIPNHYFSTSTAGHNSRLIATDMKYSCNVS